MQLPIHPDPTTGKILVEQNFCSLKGGPEEAYNVVHDGITYRCIGHPAYDLSCPVGTNVYAMKGGVVHFFGASWGFPDDGYGPLGLHAVVLLPTKEAHWYAHLSQPVVQDGSQVVEGAAFSLSGATGNVTGPHVHVGWRPSHVDYANGFDGFGDWITHLDHDLFQYFDLSLV